MSAGIYEIRSKVDDKVYIGSSINVRNRLKSHCSYLRRGKHFNAHLQAAWEKHGADNFVLRLIVVCAPKDLLLFEQSIVDGYKANDPAHGYNKRVVVESMAGCKLSEEHKRKIAASVPRGEAHMYFGQRLSDAAYAEAAALKKANGLTSEHRAKISASGRGKKKPNNKHGGTLEVILKRSKLTPQSAAEIRALYAAGGVTQADLAAKFGVCRPSISHVVNGKSWTARA
jgi:group I intron endonuclease